MIFCRYGTNEPLDSWKTPISSKFVLPLDKSSSDKSSSINNKSIHEIWSPDPSPNGLNNLSPNDEMLNSFNQQQQLLLDSPSSIVDSAETTFEQLELNCQHLPSNGMFNEAELENNEENCQTSQDCYQNLRSIYPHYDCRNLHPQQGPDLYPAVIPAENKVVIAKSMIPVVVESNTFYDNTQYMNKYQYGVSKEHISRNHYNGERYQAMYDLTMGCVEELGMCLDECRDQLRHLERDCKKVRAFNDSKSNGKQTSTLHNKCSSE